MAKSSGKKQRKFGRNKIRCTAYRNEERREKNKLRGLRKHLRNHFNDKSAIESLKAVAKTLGMKPETFHDLQEVRL